MNNFGPRAGTYLQTQGSITSNQFSGSPQKPKVGLAVVCQCAAGNTYVQCLLQKRGINSSSPNKWSFPGGRLEQPGDLEDDGAVGTKRELYEECGGGAPPGLPPLIHIECCKTGKQSQTLYHVYVVDTSHDKDWETWQPKSRNGRSTTELDTVVSSLNLQGHAFPCTNGYCWVDMSVLIQECSLLNPPELGNSDLQHGLVRWVQNYGEHILKILIARSPKLPHPRRLFSPMSTPPSQNGHAATLGPRPHLMHLDSGSKPHRFNNNIRGGMLQPPYPHGQFVQANYHSFYPVGAAPNQSQLSPPSGGVSGSNTATTPTNSLGGIQGFHPGGLMMHVPSVVAQTNPQVRVGQGVLYVPPAMNVVQPSISSPNHPTSTHPSSPTLPPQGAPGGVAGNSDGGDCGLYITPQTNSLMSTLNPLMATSTGPLGVSSSQHQLLPGQHSGGQLALPAPGGGEGGGAGGGLTNQFDQPHALSNVVPPNISSSSIFPLESGVVVSGNQFLPSPHPPLSVNTPLPPQHHPLHPAVGHAPGHTHQGDTEPLLPNPPPTVPLLPLVHPLQTMPQQPVTSGVGNGTVFPSSQQGSPLSSRKEILCRHYLQGHCPFGEKCWFAHPEPIIVGQPPRAEGPRQAVGISGSPMHVQVPPNFWPLMDYTLASPPHSPMNPALIPRPPIMFRPRGGVTYPGQQPLLFLRSPFGGAPRIPGSNFPFIPTAPIPMPVNPLLEFTLLSQVVLQNHNGSGIVTDVSQLMTYADHFHVSYGNNISTYKIVFGGNRNYRETAVPTEKKRLEQTVSCLHCSQQQPTLLLVGTEEGCVFLLDMRRGAGHGNITPVLSTEPSSVVESVSSLIHFTTSINSAQVVVIGTVMGAITWHISQPPQKTYSLLFMDRDTHAPHKVLALQMLGGFLVSGDASGKVVIWSMMSQTPFIHSSFQSHTPTLTNLHVIDANHFITIGSDASPVAEDGLNNSGSKSQIQSQFTVIPSTTLESLNLEMSQLTMQSTEDGPNSTTMSSSSDSLDQFSVKLWEFGQPPKMVKCIENVGHVMSSSSHCHNPPGNMFLGLGMKDGVIKIYNVPNFTISSELHFTEMKGKDCTHIRLNLSRETPVINPAYYRNPFRDLILTSVWSDGKIMVCQVAKQ